MADNIQFSNNASALLALPATSGDLSITLVGGYGTLFPPLSGSQYFFAAIQNAAGALEIVKCTAIVGDVLTVTRGEDNTTALAWAAGARLELRLNAEAMEEFLQKNGGSIEGAVNFQENDLTNAVITGAQTVIEGGQIVGVPVRGALNISSNQISVPGDGSRATASGYGILTQQDLLNNSGLNMLPIYSIIMWYGTLASLPAGWVLCDGNNGTPNLVGKFPYGAGNVSPAKGSTGGAATATGNTGASGDHSHSGNTGLHSLTAEQMADHTHGGWWVDGYRPSSIAGKIVGFPDVTIDYNGPIDNVINGNINEVDDKPLTTGMIGSNGTGHRHTISASGDHTHTLATIATVPPYTAIYFIMRIP